MGFPKTVSGDNWGWDSANVSNHNATDSSSTVMAAQTSRQPLSIVRENDQQIVAVRKLG